MDAVNPTDLGNPAEGGIPRRAQLSVNLTVQRRMLSQRKHPAGCTRRDPKRKRPNRCGLATSSCGANRLRKRWKLGVGHRAQVEQDKALLNATQNMRRAGA